MFLPLLAALAIVIAAAKLGGWLAGRLRQPVVLGKLLAGLLLGPSIFNLFGLEYFQQAHVTDALHEFGELGVIFLMFAAGLEVQLSDLVQAGKPAVLAGTLGVVVPLAFSLVFIPLGYDGLHALFFGIVMAATSVSISAQTLLELGRLRTREGFTLLGAAVVDDVLAIAVLSVFLALTQSQAGGIWGVLWILTRMVLFLGGAFWLGTWLLPHAVHWVEKQHLPISEPVISLVVISILAFAWASEFIGGVAAITGAFIAGVTLASSQIKEKIARGIHTLAYAFFVPIFLVSIGLNADARTLTMGDIGLVAVACVVAITSKVIGAGLGAKLGGLPNAAAWRVGIGMISRGEVGLIVAQVGLAAGLLPRSGFTAVVLMVLITTLITPPLLRWVFREEQPVAQKT